jgi:biopolymer transport protein TolR
MARQRKRRKVLSDINVVPYIDVMLVLLIIFMVTAPMMNLSVDVNLPNSTAKPVDQKDDPIVVTIDKNGQFYLSLGKDKPKEARTEAALFADLQAFGAAKRPVLLNADKEVPYGVVYQLMALAQRADLKSVGFISQPGTGK